MYTYTSPWLDDTYQIWPIIRRSFVGHDLDRNVQTHTTHPKQPGADTDTRNDGGTDTWKQLLYEECDTWRA